MSRPDRYVRESLEAAAAALLELGGDARDIEAVYLAEDGQGPEVVRVIVRGDVTDLTVTEARALVYCLAASLLRAP